MNRPKLKDHLHYEIVPPGNVFILSEESNSVLTGAAYPHLLPYLDGQHTMADLFTLLADKLPGPQLYYVLRQLEKEGYLVDGEPAGTPPAADLAPYCYALDLDAQAATERRQQARITVKALDRLAGAPLQAALASLGLATGDEGELTVVTVDDYLQPELADWNAEALANGRSWLLLRLIGHTAWIGPVFRPGHTACWQCLAQRLSTNRQVESFIQRQTGRDTPLPTARAALPTTIEMAANLAATEIFKWVVQGQNEALDGQVLTVNTLSMETQRHMVTRRPQCPACGRPDLLRQPRPVSLNGHRALHSDGRQRSAEETLAQTRHLISPITGIITWLVETTPETNGLHYTYSAGHSFAMVRDNLHWLQQSLNSRTGGKGRTQTQAQVSAVGEAIERYAAVYRGDEPVIRGSYRSLAPEAIHLQECLNFSARQYQQRHAWNEAQKGSYIHVVPNPLDETQELDWSPLWSLTAGHFRYLPSAFCYFGHPESAEFFFCAGDSSGTAAGNSLEEAILSGFLELVERDSAAIWWYNRLQRPAVDLTSFNLPYIKQLQHYYESLHREFWVIDITSDLGIPVFAAISRRVDRPVEDVIFGFAAHLDPEQALLGAIAEMNQFLPAVSQTDAQGNTRYNFVEPEAVQWWQTATVAEQPYLLPDPQAPARCKEDFPQLSSTSLSTNVQTCVDIAATAGLETLVLDQTRPDLALHSCRVVVPGLRHFWRRLGPGRLYDVPVKMGWLSQPHDEAQLNPFSIFF